MICYNDIKQYAHCFEITENDFAVLLGSKSNNCVFIKSPWGLLKVKTGCHQSPYPEYSIKACCDFFCSLTKEKADEYINEYTKQKINELTKSIAERTKRIESAKKINEKEQKQLKKFVLYSKEKEK